METFHLFCELPLEIQYAILTMDPILTIKASQLCHTTRQLVRRDYLLAKCACPISKWEIRHYLNTNPQRFVHFIDSSTCNIFIRQSMSDLDRVARLFADDAYTIHPYSIRLYNNDTGRPTSIAYCGELGKTVTYRDGVIIRYEETFDDKIQKIMLDLTDPAHTLDLFSQFEIMASRLKNKKWASRLIRHRFKAGITSLIGSPCNNIDRILRTLITYHFLLSHLIILKEREITVFTDLIDLKYLDTYNPNRFMWNGVYSDLSMEEITRKEEEIQSMRERIEIALTLLSEN